MGCENQHVVLAAGVEEMEICPSRQLPGVHVPGLAPELGTSMIPAQEVREVGSDTVSAKRAFIL